LRRSAADANELFGEESKELVLDDRATSGVTKIIAGVNALGSNIGAGDGIF